MKKKSTIESAKTTGVNTLRIAVKILDEVAQSSDPARITDLARRLNMTLSSVSRHVATWRDLGYVDRIPSSEAVRLGARLIGLGQAAEAQNSQVALARPFLIKLRDELNYTVLLSARVQRHATLLECIMNQGPAIISSRPGARLLLPHSPTARVIWAFGVKQEERARLHEAVFDFSADPHFNKTLLKKKLALLFEQQYDYSVEVPETGIGAIACPIFNADGTCKAAVTLMIPSKSMSDPPAAEVVKALKRAAVEISEVLSSAKYGF